MKIRTGRPVVNHKFLPLQRPDFIESTAIHFGRGVFNFFSVSSAVGCRLSVGGINHNWSVFAISRISAACTHVCGRGVAGLRAGGTKGRGGVSLCKCTRKPDARSTDPLPVRPLPPTPRHVKLNNYDLFVLFILLTLKPF